MVLKNQHDLLLVALLAYLAPRSEELEKRVVWCSGWGHPTRMHTDGELGLWKFFPVKGGYYLISWYREGMADSDCLVLCAPVQGKITTTTARPIFVPAGMRHELERLYTSLFPQREGVTSSA